MLSHMAGGPCVFCEIVAGRERASLVAESADALAFLTIGPLSEGHTLVIPKRHVVEVPEAGPQDLASVFDLAAEVARRQRRFLASQGENLVLASGLAAEQSVFHLHLHVVPRRSADALDLTSWWEERVKKPTRDRLDSTAAILRGQ
jgi:diadenosine tetraphosphate (Ap4A) HIT family hydrolase